MPWPITARHTAPDIDASAARHDGIVGNFGCRRRSPYRARRRPFAHTRRLDEAGAEDRVRATRSKIDRRRLERALRFVRLDQGSADFSTAAAATAKGTA